VPIPRVPASDRRIPLPQVRRTLPQGPTRIGRWRCAALIVVHVLIAAHIAHWLITGRSVGRFVLSDAMRTLENGEVNPGFLLFAAAALLTVICGRFLCGWACHMGALQDLCAWALKKAGVRPHRFSSRLLAWAPLAAGVYMFVWPSLRRDVLVPAVERVYPAGVGWLGGWHEFPGFSVALTSSDLWSGLPGVWVAVPFLLVCGVATVYFLGSRGFCRYACPYGGIFKPLERLAPVRIVVDHARCDQCGLCTAACTTGVRVMEETHATGIVTDSRCLRSLDCVSVCPNSALSLGWAGLPGLRTEGPRPRPAYDLSWRGELASAGVFVVTLLATRGLYGVIPLMMALGIAGCAAAVFWKAAQVLRRPNSRLPPWQLRRAGRLRPAGAAYLAAAAILGTLLLHSAAVQSIHFAAGIVDGRVTVGPEVVFSGSPVPEAQRSLAERALRWYSRARGWRDGGVGLASTPASDGRAAWLALVAGRPSEALRFLESVAEREGMSDVLASDLARIELLRGEGDAAVARLERHVAASGAGPATQDLLESLYVSAGRVGDAVGLAREWVRLHPSDGVRRGRLGLLLAQTGDAAGAREALARAAADAPGVAWIREWLAATERKGR